MPKRLTEEEFRNRLKEVSNDTIEVLDDVYKGTQETYTFRCKVCGYEWKTKGYSVLQGHGCRKCYDKRNSESRLYPIEEVQRRIDESGSETEIIGDYIDTKHKCKAMCRKCGNVWYPNVGDIMYGHGCPKCAKNTKNNKIQITEISHKETSDKKDGKTEIFVQKAQKIHGDKYDYSKVEYKDSSTKVCIICHEKDKYGNEHGEFWQTPNKHLSGHGCLACSHHIKLTFDEFIRRAKLEHGNKYDYSKVNYKDSRTKVCIICPEHGEFWQTPNIHLCGHGCPKCGLKHARDSRAYNTEEFIKRAKDRYGDKYDYSKVNYVNNSTKVLIKCPEHGWFWQTPSRHLIGEGCIHVVL